MRDGMSWNSCLLDRVLLLAVLEYKYLSCVYGVDRKICHEGHWSASLGCRVMPNSDPEWQIFLSTPYTHDRYFFLHTLWLTTFDFQSRTCYEITLFPLKGFYLSLKKSTLPLTADRFFTFTSNLHKVNSFFDVTAVKTSVTWRHRYVTSNTTNALNTRDFYPALGETTWVRLDL